MLLAAQKDTQCFNYSKYIVVKNLFLYKYFLLLRYKTKEKRLIVTVSYKLGSSLCSETVFLYCKLSGGVTAFWNGECSR